MLAHMPLSVHFAERGVRRLRSQVGRGLGWALVGDLVGCPRPLGRLTIRRASWLGRAAAGRRTVREVVLSGASTREKLGGSKSADEHIEVLVEREILVPHRQKRATRPTARWTCDLCAAPVLRTAVDVARTSTRAAVDRISGDTDVRMVSMGEDRKSVV